MFQNTNRQKNHVVSKSINHSQASKTQSTKQCNYCKKLDHTINECYKRQYNNTRKQNQQNPSGTNTPSASNTNQRNTQTINFQQQNFRISDHLPNPPEIEQVHNSGFQQLPNVTISNLFFTTNDLTYVLFYSNSCNSPDKALKFLIDTGASISLVKTSSLNNFQLSNTNPIILNRLSVNSPIQTLGETIIELEIHNHKINVNIQTIDVPTNIPFDGLLGDDFLISRETKVDYSNCTISIKSISCKKLGHVIEECRKRQYNNNMREQTNSKPNTSRPNPHPINFQQNFPRACELPKPPERVEQITQNLDRFAM